MAVSHGTRGPHPDRLSLLEREQAPQLVGPVENDHEVPAGCGRIVVFRLDHQELPGIRRNAACATWLS